MRERCGFRTGIRGGSTCDRIVADIRDPDTPREDSERFFFNWNRKGGGRAVDPARWALLKGDGEWPAAKEQIGIGFDGSISGDATALIGCTSQGRLFLIEAWERPLGADPDWRVPRLAVHQAVEAAFERWQVGRMLCDPPKWETEIDQWAERFGEDTVLRLDTFSERRFGPAVSRFRTAIAEGTLSHDGSDVLERHVLAATLKKTRSKDPEDDGRTMYVITKGEDARKIDAAVAAVLALEAAMTMPPLELVSIGYYGMEDDGEP
jgi:hypothetical protein